MSLLQDVNNTVKLQEQEDNIINNNIKLLSENIDESSEFITEAITNWLAKVHKVVGSGRLDPEKQKSVSEILGAVSALSSPDTAEAFNEKGDLGTVLFMASSKNPQESNAALKRLREIGRHESARTYTAQALQSINDPASFTGYINKSKTAIDRVMRSNLAKEKSATQDPATKDPTSQNPAQSVDASAPQAAT